MLLRAERYEKQHKIDMQVEIIRGLEENLKAIEEVVKEKDEHVEYLKDTILELRQRIEKIGNKNTGKGDVEL